MARNRTPRRSAEIVARTIQELTYANRTDELIKRVCIKNKIGERHIRSVSGWIKR